MSELKDFAGLSEQAIELAKQEAPEMFQESEEPPQAPKEPDEGNAVPEESADGAAEKTPEDKRVPLAALHEEREKRRQLQQRLEAVQDQMNQLSMAQIEQARAMQRKGQEAPQKEVDPLEELIETKLRERLKPIEQETKAQQAAREFEARITVQEQRSKEMHPDYDEISAPVLAWLNQCKDAAMRGDRQAAMQFHSFMNQPNPAEAAYMLGCTLRHQQGAQKAPEQPAPRAQQPKPALPRSEGIPGGGAGPQGQRIDLENMTTSEWAKLPLETRKRLLRGEGI